MQAPTTPHEEGQAKEAASPSPPQRAPQRPAAEINSSPLPSPSPSPSPSLSGSIGALGLSVDSVTLSGPISYGLPGRVIFSLRELEKGETWYTENRNSVRRISDTHVLLGETIELAIPEEEDFDVSRGILTFNGEQPLLLVTVPALLLLLQLLLLPEDAQVSAEAEVERLSGMKFYEGIPLSSVEVEGAQERGIVVFTLQQLPDGQPFYFDHKSRLTIARMGDNRYAINGKEFQGAVVKQVLPSDSSLLDLVFPHGGRKESDLDDDDGGGEGNDGEGGDGSGSHEAIMQQIMAAAAASEEAQADEEEEIARAMLREFDERLKGATLRRAQEKRRRLSLMMKQYSTDPSSPFRALFLPSSPLSTSGTTIPVRLQPQDRNDSQDHQQQSPAEATHRNDGDDVHASETAGGLVIPSGRADHGETRPDAGLGGECKQELPRQDLQLPREEARDDDGLLLEDVDLNTPRHERRAAPAPHADGGHGGGDGGAPAEHHQHAEEQARVVALVEKDGDAAAAAGHMDDELEQQESGDHHHHHHHQHHHHQHHEDEEVARSGEEEDQPA